VHPEHWQHSKQLLQSISEGRARINCALSRDEQISMSEWERWQQIKTGAFITRWNANRVGALTLWTSKKVSDPRATMQRSATFAFTTSGTTFGTRLADSGASTRTIMDLMGHSQMTTSARYTHATDHGKRRASGSAGSVRRDDCGRIATKTKRAGTAPARKCLIVLVAASGLEPLTLGL